MGAALWGGLCACAGQDEAASGNDSSAPPDTGSTSYALPALPCLELTDEVCEALDAWITMQAGNGDPGEGSAEWGEFLRYLAEQYPEAVVSEPESE